MSTANKHTTTDKLITRITAWMAGAILLALLIWGIISLCRISAQIEAQMQCYQLLNATANF